MTPTITEGLWILAHRQHGLMTPARTSQDAWTLGIAAAFGIMDAGSFAFKQKKAEMRSQGWVARRCKMIVEWS